MANSKGPSTIRTMMYNGKNSLLPPKSPFPSLSPSYTEYIPNSTIGSKILPKKPGDSSLHHHQRTSSESFLMDEQPSWLDELLDEPETPVRSRGHRRSSSDSFAYTDMSNTGFMNNNNSYVAQDGNNNNGYGNMAPLSSWGSHDFDIYRDARQNAFYMDLNNFGKTRNKMWDPPAILPHGLPSPRRNNTLVNTSQDGDKNSSLPDEKRDTSESGHQDPKGRAEKEPPSHGKPTETDNKRAKQQFAQRSRVRKLQYIAELERNVQALQAEGSEVSAELEFVNQQNLILSMENKALKQRLDNLAEEQLIKYLEHQLLEREVGRLRSLYEHQQQPPQQQPQTGPGHRRANSRDLDQQFSNLSLKPKEGRDSVSGQLHM